MPPLPVHENNTAKTGIRPLPASTRRRLRRAYGPLWNIVRVTTTADLVASRRGRGWRSQQAAKLAVSRQITTSHYVVLDAKNHLTAPTDSASFVALDGRAHGAFHPYREHPLRPSLQRTLGYLGATSEQIHEATTSFPPTATPFVFTTVLFRELLEGVESLSSAPLGVAF